MLRVPWTARRTNESIRLELQLDGLTLANTCMRRIVQFFGHVARGNEDSLERLVVVGGLEGKRGRGRSPARWTDQVKTAAGTSVVGELRAAQSRDSWRRAVEALGVTTLNRHSVISQEQQRAQPEPLHRDSNFVLHIFLQWTNR